MVEDPLTECEVCGAPVQRVFHPVAVHFKGSGFYNTDYGKNKKAGAGSDTKPAETKSSSDGKSSSDSKKSDSTSSSGSSSSSSSD